MGRPPCCEMSGVKKGPWSPEEDLLLISYVQDHGAMNWRAVPANTGLMRCSKSCRLRWTNYLRPGIKRGKFSNHEERLIIKLQKLLGNKWSTIALYMPDRTDSDIKNYWNTHLKKKLAKTSGPCEKGQWEQRLQTDFHTARLAFQEALSIDTMAPTIKLKMLPLTHLSELTIDPPMYASNIENIARLLECWMRPSASEKASAMSPISGGGEGRSRSHNDMANVLEVFTGEPKVEGMTDTVLGPSSLLMGLESWMLDDGMGQGETDLLYMPLADPGEFF